MARRLRGIALLAVVCIIALVGKPCLAQFDIRLRPDSERPPRVRPEGLTSLARDLGSADPKAQLQALDRLQRNREHIALFSDRVLELTDSDDVDVRAKSLSTLGGLTIGSLDETIEEVCRRRLSDENPNVRYAAASTLASLVSLSESTGDQLLAKLDDSDADVQYAVLAILLRCSELRKKALPKVWPLLKSEESRSHAISDHGRIHVPLARDAAGVIVKHLEDFLGDEPDDEDFRAQVDKALRASEDRRVKLVLALGLDSQAEPGGPALATVIDAVRAKDAEDLCRELLLDHFSTFWFEFPYDDHVRFRLLLECSKGGGKTEFLAGCAMTQILASNHDRKMAEAAIADEKVPPWIREVMKQWIKACAPAFK